MEKGDVCTSGMDKQTIIAKKGATTSHSVYLSREMDGDSNCEYGIIQFPSGKTMGGHTAQAIWEISLTEEFAKMYVLTGTIAFSSGRQHLIRV
jgi:hypothetical protein